MKRVGKTRGYIKLHLSHLNMNTPFINNAPVHQPTTHQADLAVKLMCKECRDKIPIIHEDFKTGDLICGTCGMIMGNRIIDTRSEWRTFSSGDDAGGDPSRVGGNSDPLMMGNGGLESTSISQKDNTMSGMSKDLSKTHSRTIAGKGERQTDQAFKDIQVMCERIGVGRVTTDSAKQLFQKVSMENMLRGKSQEAVIASCIYIACREQNVTRTFKEIYALTKVSKKDIGKCFKALQTLLSNPLQSVNLDSYVSRFCSLLDVEADVQNTAMQVVTKCATLGTLDGKSPISLVAACLFFALSLSNNPKSSKDIADVSGCTEVTLRNAYKLLYEVKEKIGDGISFAFKIENLPVS